MIGLVVVLPIELVLVVPLDLVDVVVVLPLELVVVVVGVVVVADLQRQMIHPVSSSV